jgi:hypothetical protein
MSSKVQLLGNVPTGAALGMDFKDHAPIPEIWLGGTTAPYAPSEIWGFGCPTTNVAVA